MPLLSFHTIVELWAGRGRRGSSRLLFTHCLLALSPMALILPSAITRKAIPLPAYQGTFEELRSKREDGLVKSNFDKNWFFGTVRILNRKLCVKGILAQDVGFVWRPLQREFLDFRGQTFRVKEARRMVRAKLAMAVSSFGPRRFPRKTWNPEWL